MMTKFDLKKMGGNMVYVKSVDVADLPGEVQDQAGDHAHLFAVHDAAGKQLALVADRRMAYALALQNDLSPVTVH